MLSKEALSQEAHWAGCVEFVFGTDLSGQVRHRLPAEHAVHAVAGDGLFARCGVDARTLQPLEKPWLEWLEHYRCTICHARTEQY
jgi:hypothetical protein